MRAASRLGRQRKKRSFRVRNGIRANSGRVRLSIFRSNKHIYAQLIDDVQRVTIASASTMQKGAIGDDETGGNVEAAKKVGANGYVVKNNLQELLGKLKEDLK